MALSSPAYCSREDVQRALDVKVTARAGAQVDRAIEAATATVDGLTNRRFVPEIDTRYFDWPFNGQHARPWRLWLDQHELIAVTTLIAGGVTIPPTSYNLEPNGSGPPYTSIELRLDKSAFWGGGPTPQRAVAIFGLFGYGADTAAAGALAEVLDASETGVDVTDTSTLGVGDLIAVDDERMLITGRQMLTTGQTLQAPLTALASDVTVAVTSGTAFAVDELLLVDAERMLIVDIAGNNLVVKRAWDGTVLAAHTGSAIYVPRTLTVTRGAAGTTAATHLLAAPVLKHLPPPLVRALALAEAVNQILQETSGYARAAASPDSQQPSGSGRSRPLTTGAGLPDLRMRVLKSYGRQARTRAV